MTDTPLHRRIWRWHFYAGLVCLPFLTMMAVTGSLYLFKYEIEALVYRPLWFVPSAAPAQLDPEALVAQALVVVPGRATRFVAPPDLGRSAEVGVRSAAGDRVSVYLDPQTGRVLGTLRDDLKLMELVRHIHSLVIAGTVANHWIEIVAGWAIVLVVSGLFLWWPRGRRGGVYSVRGRPAQRTWWRDLHAVTGVTAAAAILFLAVTGMPWSAFWGAQFGHWTNEWGVGLPKYLWGQPPESAIPMASLGNVPWTLTRVPLPQSEGGHANHAGVVSRTAAATAGVESSIGLDRAIGIFKGLGIPQGTPINLPDGARGVYTAMLFPDDARAERVVHLDQYSGVVLADVGYRDYGIAGRVTEWGISLHTGRQFGLANQIVMLFGCMAIVVLAVSAVVMWWKRRPRGHLAAPPRGQGEAAARNAVAVAVMLGLLYPLLGASMLVALATDALIPRHWHERFGL